MSTEKQLESIKHTVKFSSSDPNRTCPKCPESIKSVDNFINHMVSQHRYKLLNIGTETDVDGSRTVAYLGSND